MKGTFGVINQFLKWKKGDLPCDPTVILALNEWGMKDDVVTIFGTLASDAEIDFAVDQLKKHLELARKEAKRVLKFQREKIKSSIEE